MAPSAGTLHHGRLLLFRFRFILGLDRTGNGALDKVLRETSLRILVIFVVKEVALAAVLFHLFSLSDELNDDDQQKALGKRSKLRRVSDYLRDDPDCEYHIFIIVSEFLAIYDLVLLIDKVEGVEECEVEFAHHVDEDE